MQFGKSVELNRSAGLQGKELEEEESREHATPGPFRGCQMPPPKIGSIHAWGMMKWGKKSGPWGPGPDGVEQRKDKEKDS